MQGLQLLNGFGPVAGSHYFAELQLAEHILKGKPDKFVVLDEQDGEAIQIVDGHGAALLSPATLGFM